MASLEQYANKYQSIKMERRNGILQLTFHTGGGPLQWGGGPHQEFPQAFGDVGSDPENRVVIMTGAGDSFSGPAGTSQSAPKRSPREWDKTYWEGKKTALQSAGHRSPHDQRHQRPGVAPFGNPVVVRHRTRLRHRRVSGLRAFR